MCSVLDLLVPLEVTGVGEPAVADGAAEGPLSGVHVAVDVQLALAHETLATQQAGVGLLPCVPGHVFVQVRLQEEALGADGAAERALHGDGVVEGVVEAAGEGFVVAQGAVQGHAVRIAGGDDTGRSSAAGRSWSVTGQNLQRGLHLH